MRPFASARARLPAGDLHGFAPITVRRGEQLIGADKPKYNPVYLWSRDPAAARAVLAAGRALEYAARRARRGDLGRRVRRGLHPRAVRRRGGRVARALVDGGPASRARTEALAGTERAQDEFFHLFEALKRRGSRVLLVANRPPREIRSIDERLRSRFEGGLVLEVEAKSLPRGSGDRADRAGSGGRRRGDRIRTSGPGPRQPSDLDRRAQRSRSSSRGDGHDCREARPVRTKPKWRLVAIARERWSGTGRCSRTGWSRTSSSRGDRRRAPGRRAGRHLPAARDGPEDRLPERSPDRSNFGYVYFENGPVIHASVLNRQDRLGELLVRNNVITRRHLSQAMEMQGYQKGARLGELLVRNGSLTQEELQRYIQLQIEEAVYHLFTWTQGSFHFDPDQRPDEQGINLVSISAESLLMEGARRVDEWGLIEKKIPSLDAVFQIEKRPENSKDVELTAEQKKILPLIDGLRSVDELAHESGMVEFETCKALYGLLQAGFIGRAGERESPADEAGTEITQRLNLGVAFYRSGMMEDAVRELEAVLAKNPKHPRARFRLGLIAFRSGRLTEALEHFDRLPEEDKHAYSVLRNRALALEHLHRFPEALELLDQAERAKPGDPATALARGIVRLKSGDVPGAMEALRAYRTSPSLKKPSALYYAYTSSRRRWPARSTTRAGRARGVVALSDVRPAARQRGRSLERRGEGEAAEALYARAVQAHAVPAQAHKNLGDQAWARGDQTAARVHYEKAVKLEPRLGDDIYLDSATSRTRIRTWTWRACSGAAPSS
jgi:tetratricopeptide (TPR) repeat protein